MDWWTSSFIIGIVSGLVCATITWLIKPVPRLRICKDISLNKDGKYQFKIQNKGRHNISILSLHILLCFKGEFYIIKGIEVPLMHSSNNAKRMNKTYTYERLVGIDVQRIKKDTISKTNDMELIEKHKNRQLTLQDFIKNDKDLRIEVAVMALNCHFNTTKYYTTVLSSTIKKGEYDRGKCKVENGQTPTAD